MAMIRIQNLTFAYPGSYDAVFSDVSFTMDTDWKLGFTGRNGRGKTTFLKLLMGEYAYEGTIQAPVVFDYFPFAIPDDGKETLAVLEALDPNMEFWMLCRELSLLDMGEDVLFRPFFTLSPGERTKVLLAFLFSRENMFLLIDEPTNHLDEAGRAMVSRYLNGKKGFILVSHDRAFLDGCVDHILSINKTDIEIQKGNFTSWWENKERQDQYEMDENEKRKREISKLSAAARRTSGWSDKIEKSKFGEAVPDRGYIGHQAAKMMQRAKSIENRRDKAIAEKKKLLKNIETAEALKIHPLFYHKEVLIEAKDLSIHYGEKMVADGIDFTVKRGERIALWGKNGSGKSSLLKLLAGEDISHRGTLVVGSGLRISYLPQETGFLTGMPMAYARECGIDETLFFTILRKLDFPRVQFEKPMEDYSAGQKKKVLIAKSLCESAHLYLWDEPLNYIDVYSRMQIETLLLQHAPTMVLVEHDRAFVDGVCTRRVVLGE
ncbi:ABC-F type ribosomal protection protein [Eubacteriales bacterium OttesenSCG-928-M02]|nr:ABC-F type ribosomal protection protein [Eubacteriales bacterium OttesenSCG-928-M02]